VPVFKSFLIGSAIYSEENFIDYAYAPPELDDQQEITPYGLRHTHATILLNDLENNIRFKSVAERLGNTPAMIMDIYGHTTIENEEVILSPFAQKMKKVGAEGGENTQ